jgi:hypothetical protein
MLHPSQLGGENKEQAELQTPSECKTHQIQLTSFQPVELHSAGVTKFLKPSVAGFLLQKELDYLDGE